MNPYLNRVMIRNIEDFYGRQREIMRLYSRIGAPRPQSVSIVGDRRIGKSSLFHFISHEFNRQKYLSNPHEYIFLFLDLQEKGDMTVKDFFATLSNQCAKTLGDRVHIDPDHGYDSFARLISDLESKKMKTIMLFDEFEVVTKNPNFDMTFFAFLRSLANRYNVAYITSSGRNLQELCHTKEISDSPFFNIFTPLQLTVFSRDEALELIAKSAAADVPLSDYADFLIDLAGTFPIYLQIACCALFEYLQSHTKIEEADLAEIKESFADEAIPHFQHVWDEQFEDRDQTVMRKLVLGENIERAEMYALNQLERRGYVIKKGKEYAPFSSVFSEVIERDIGGRPQPQLQPQPERSYLPQAIVVMDMCGHSTMVQKYGSHFFMGLFSELRDLVNNVAGRYQRSCIRSRGDGFLLAFPAIEKALEATLEIQSRLKDRNRSLSEKDQIWLRYAIHFGEALVDSDGEPYGDTVNMTFRMESLRSEHLIETQGGISKSEFPQKDYILITEVVYKDLKNRPGIRCQLLGFFELSGFVGLHRIYQLSPPSHPFPLRGKEFKGGGFN